MLVFLAGRDIGCIKNNIVYSELIQSAMNAIATKYGLIGRIILSSWKQPLKITIEKFRIGRLCEVTVFNPINKDRDTPALFMSI
jgi:hypothetical protein